MGPAFCCLLIKYISHQFPSDLTYILADDVMQQPNQKCPLRTRQINKRDSGNASGVPNLAAQIALRHLALQGLESGISRPAPEHGARDPLPWRLRGGRSSAA